MNKVVSFVIIIFVILFAFYFIQQDKVFEYNDMVRVYAPLPGEKVGNYIDIKGEARGYWFFEASFPIVLIDGNGTIIGQTLAQAKSDWMTDDFVVFEAEMNFETEEKNGTLVFQKDNPSGLPENDDSFEINIKF